MNSGTLAIIKNEILKNIGFEVVIEHFASIQSSKIKLNTFIENHIDNNLYLFFNYYFNYYYLHNYYCLVFKFS